MFQMSCPKGRCKDSEKIRIFALKIKTLKYAVANIQISKRGGANVQ